MIRLIVFLLITVGLAFAAAWLADRPGEVSIDWLGYHADTSVAILIGCVLAIVCAALIAWTLLVYLMDAPARLARRNGAPPGAITPSAGASSPSAPAICAPRSNMPQTRRGMPPTSR